MGLGGGGGGGGGEGMTALTDQFQSTYLDILL